MKIEITPTKITQETLDWDYIKSHPGVYESLNQGLKKVFISLGYQFNNDIPRVLYSSIENADFAICTELSNLTGWYQYQFIKSDRKITFSN